MSILKRIRHTFGRPRRVLVFGPATSTMPAGPRLLIGNPDFRRAFIEASDFVEARRGWSLWKELGNDAPPEGVSAAERNFVQEVVFQLSLFRAFQAANVEFDAVAGISLGDAAAGHAAGAITFEETLQIMCETIRAVLCAGGGDLVAVQAPPSRVAELVSDPAVALIFDWPVLSVWAVPDAAARRMLRQLRVARIAYARLGFNCLSHTSRVDVAGMLSALSTLPSREPSHLLFSTLEGGVVTEPPPPLRWVRAISEPVRLDAMWRTMRDRKYTDIIYIGSVPADQDLFAGLPANERPTSYERAEKFITIPEVPEGETAEVSSARLSDVGVALRSSAFARDPYPYYGKWVREGTVHKLPGEDFFVVTGYDAAIHVLKHPESFSSSPFASLSALILGADAPLHTRVRRALSPFFTRERILARRDHVAAIVTHAVESMSQRKQFDACNEFALPLTFGVWCDALGLHQEHAATVAPMRSADALWQDVEFALNGSGVLAEVLERGELSREEIGQLVPFLISAGALTMRDTVCFTIYTLLRKPDLLRSLTEDPSLVPDFVEELLRFEPGVHGVPRKALTETVIGGVTIPANSMVWVLIGAAHRDPAKFECPDDFVMKRHGEKHIAFGAGPHYCLGNHLGRMEAEMVVEALLPVLPRLRATHPPEFFFTDMRDNDPRQPFMRGMRFWQLAFTS